MPWEEEAEGTTPDHLTTLEVIKEEVASTEEAGMEEDTEEEGGTEEETVPHGSKTTTRVTGAAATTNPLPLGDRHHRHLAAAGQAVGLPHHHLQA